MNIVLTQEIVSNLTSLNVEEQTIIYNELMQYEDNKEVHLKDHLKIIFNLAIALIKKELKQSEKKKKNAEYVRKSRAKKKTPLEESKLTVCKSKEVQLVEPSCEKPLPKSKLTESSPELSQTNDKLTEPSSKESETNEELIVYKGKEVRFENLTIDEQLDYIDNKLKTPPTPEKIKAWKKKEKEEKEGLERHRLEEEKIAEKERLKNEESDRLTKKAFDLIESIRKKTEEALKKDPHYLDIPQLDPLPQPKVYVPRTCNLEELERREAYKRKQYYNNKHKAYA